METLTELFTTLTGWIDSIAALVTDSPLTYLLILGLTALDAIVPVIPAEGTITAAAVLAGTGQLDIVWVVIAAAVGAFIGDNLAYWIGRAAGRPLVERVLRGNLDGLADVQRQFARRGGIFIIVGRFVPGGRTAVAVGAGVLHYGWPRFIVYDAVAVALWALLAAVPGFIGGVAFAERPWLALVIGFALSLLVAGGLAFGQRWWQGRTGSAVAAAGPDLAVAGVLGVAGAAGDDGDGDAEPGEGGRPQQPEVAQREQVTDLAPDRLADEGADDRRDEDGKRAEPDAAAEDEVDAGMEGADDER